jgi:hypothetical protein
MEQWLFDSAKTAGPIVGLVVFFVWWSFRRETAMSVRLTQVEDFVKDKLLSTLDRTTETISRNTDVLQATKEALSTVNNLPCINGDFREAMCKFVEKEKGRG